MPTQPEWGPHDARLRLAYEGEVFQLYEIKRSAKRNAS